MYCNPKKQQAKDKSCFSKESLIKLIEIWNNSKVNFNNKIIFKESFTTKKLWKLLNDKLNKVCNDKQDWCWPNAIDNISSDLKDKKI